MTTVCWRRGTGGVKVYEVEGTLSRGRVGYRAYRTLFRADRIFPRMHLFDSDGKEVRTFQVKHIATVSAEMSFGSPRSRTISAQRRLLLKL